MSKKTLVQLSLASFISLVAAFATPSTWATDEDLDEQTLERLAALSAQLEEEYPNCFKERFKELIADQFITKQVSPGQCLTLREAEGPILSAWRFCNQQFSSDLISQVRDLPIDQLFSILPKIADMIAEVGDHVVSQLRSQNNSDHNSILCNTN